jgi:pyrroloquinoline quinone (PQQ) biosynthesis protein C
LAQAHRRVGLDRDYVISLAGLLPATFCGQAYVHFVRDKTLLEAVASSLTGCSRRRSRTDRWDAEGYDFVSADTLAYFANGRRLLNATDCPRLRQAQRQNPGRPTGRAQALEFK